MKFVPSAITRLAGRNLLNIQSNSPKLLFGIGIVGVVGTAVLASRATLRVEEILDKAQDDLKNIDVLIDEKYIKQNNYDLHDQRKDKAYIYLRTVKELGILYCPAFVCGSLSIAALTKSHSILTKRNAGLTAAYAAMDRAFSEYRHRVREELGEEKERELYYPLEKCEIDTVDEKGDKLSKEIQARGHSMYARLFGRQTSASWSPTPEYNVIFLRAQQNAANQRLHANGYLFLNDVYESLGLERTPAGQVVGWILGEGDGYVDFGIFDNEMEPRHLEFFMGHEDAILLDFNVSGVMYNKI